ncbi:MAG: ComF family protein, partial [Candidatus Zixiibacteriota bacterium]
LCCGRFTDDYENLVCSNCREGIAELDLPFCSGCYAVLEDGAPCPGCLEEYALPVYALGHFVDPLKEIIHQFKYYGFQNLGKVLADRLVDKYFGFLDRLGLNYLVPIPLHSYRQKSRGFNQASILSDIIGSRLDVPVETESLLKTHRTKDQAKLIPRRRAANIAGAFRISGERLTGKTVAVVDDVVTTGTTVREAARVLTEAGAKPVAVIAVAAAGY